MRAGPSLLGRSPHFADVTLMEFSITHLAISETLSFVLGEPPSAGSPRQVQLLLTLFAKFFSPFEQSTCALSNTHCVFCLPRDPPRLQVVSNCNPKQAYSGPLCPLSRRLQPSHSALPHEPNSGTRATISSSTNHICVINTPSSLYCVVLCENLAQGSFLHQHTHTHAAKITTIAPIRGTRVVRPAPLLPSQHIECVHQSVSSHHHQISLFFQSPPSHWEVFALDIFLDMGGLSPSLVQTAPGNFNTLFFECSQTPPLSFLWHHHTLVLLVLQTLSLAPRFTPGGDEGVFVLARVVPYAFSDHLVLCGPAPNHDNIHHHPNALGVCVSTAFGNFVPVSRHRVWASSNSRHTTNSGPCFSTNIGLSFIYVQQR